MNQLLTVEGITKNFKARRVLEEVSFSVRPGEVLGLIGPNGAGKTTLFECLAGLMPANTGTFKFRDRELPPAHRKDVLFYLPDAIFPWAEQRVKWVIRFFERLYPHSALPAATLMAPLRLDELLQAR